LVSCQRTCLEMWCLLLPGKTLHRHDLMNLTQVSCQSQHSPESATDKRAAESQVLTLRCDLTKVPENGMVEYTNQQYGRFIKFWVQIEISVSERVLVKVTSAGKTLVSQEVPL